MNITAQEIDRQSQRATVQAETFLREAYNIINNLHELSNIVKSEDSSLATRLYDYAEYYMNLCTNIYNKYISLSKTMHDYAETTTVNEQQTAQKIQSAISASSNTSTSSNASTASSSTNNDTQWDALFNTTQDGKE